MTFLRSVLFKYFIYLFIYFILDQKGKNSIWSEESFL